jgi:cyanophycinase-like exopeptidase
MAPGIDVVVVPTAAAFTGAAEAALTVAQSLEGLGAQLEALMVSDRTSANEPHFASRIEEASLVLLCDGSPLHARSVWRDSLVGAALAQARRVVAVGATASVLGEVMIDPRGGAPTTGLGLASGVAFCAPASEEQLTRTRTLLDEGTALVVLGERGVVAHENGTWRVVVSEDVIVSRGTEVTAL